VKTDSALALKTRKGTGFYKVPSLRGVWCRGRYLHDGAVTSLEEMFNPEPLQSSFVPSGFKGLDERRAVPGHEFGPRPAIGARRSGNRSTRDSAPGARLATRPVFSGIPPWICDTRKIHRSGIRSSWRRELQAKRKTKSAQSTTVQMNQMNTCTESPKGVGLIRDFVVR
jgi:hypothetical protein